MHRPLPLPAPRLPVYLKTRLRLLILITLLPVAGVGVVGTWLLVQREIGAVQAGTWERTRALTTAVDAELQASISALQLLAASPLLRAGALEAFRPEAERALHLRREKWLGLEVTDAVTGEAVLSAGEGARLPAPPPADPLSLQQSVQTRRAAVSALLVAPPGGRKLFAIRVPVVADTEPVRRIVTAFIDLQVLDQLVEAQRFPTEWAAAVVDGQSNLVVRKPAMPEGMRIGESLRRALQSPTHGWTQGRLADGRQVYRTVQRSTLSDWSVAVAIPKAEVEESLRYVKLLWLGFGIALAGSLWLAWWLAKGVGAPITALADAAPALGRGQALALPDPGSIEEVRRLYDALQQASARLRERDADRAAAEAALRAANRAKDEFLAMLGHELRNPLSSLSNAAELLQHGAQRADVIPKVAGVLSRQVGQMTRLVDDLLEVGRVTAGKINLVKAPLDLAEAVRHSFAALDGTGRLAGHHVALDMQPVWVEADAARLEQVIANLLDNALKYTPAGGRIGITVRAEGDSAVLEVSDTGQGMSPELAQRAFDLFVQGERPLARDSGGLGIGLTLAQRLAQLHGGEISAHSAGEGQGSTFRVRLPAIAAPAGAAAAQAPEAAAVPAARRVLVIEDNADAGESLVVLLEMLGHQAEWCGLGLAGVERALALAPDLVLVDIGLPDIDGYEVAGRIRAQPQGRAMRLVALTGYGTPEDRSRALAAGFDDHLAKPIGMPELEALLARPSAS